jgi:hypothetical protein
VELATGSLSCRTFDWPASSALANSACGSSPSARAIAAKCARSMPNRPCSMRLTKDCARPKREASSCCVRFAATRAWTRSLRALRSSSKLSGIEVRGVGVRRGFIAIGLSDAFESTVIIGSTGYPSWVIPSGDTDADGFAKRVFSCRYSFTTMSSTFLGNIERRAGWIMNNKLRIAAITAGISLVAIAGLAHFGRQKVHRNIEAICENRVNRQIGDRRVSFSGPVHTFVDSGEYLLHWSNLQVEDSHGRMRQRMVMCTVQRRDGDWDGKATFIDGDALK